MQTFSRIDRAQSCHALFSSGMTIVLLSFFPLTATFADDHIEESDFADSTPEFSLLLGTDRQQVLPDPETTSDNEDEDRIELGVDWAYALNDTFAFGSSVVAEAFRQREPDFPDWKSRSRLYLDALFIDVSLPRYADSHLRLGRQELAEARGWWWDETLDALALAGGRDPWHYQLAAARVAEDVSTDPDDIDPDFEDVYWILAETRFAPQSVREVGAYAVARLDESSSYRSGTLVAESVADDADADLGWLGLRLRERITSGRYGTLDVQLDAGLMRGRETLAEYVADDDEDEDVDEDVDEEDAVEDGEEAVDEFLEVADVERRSVSGWGFDNALIWHSTWPFEPVFTLRVAGGSGTPSSRRAGSRSFRQSGIHDNSDTFAYYGELFDPALSNINIQSLSIDWPVADIGTLSIAGYRYRKRHVGDAIGDTGVDADPEAPSRDLGSEFGVYASVELAEDWQLDLSWSVFEAGDAYGALAGETAELLFLELDIEF